MKNNKKTILILLISIILLALLVLIGFTYAKIIPMVENTGSSINTGNITFTYTESSNELSIDGEDSKTDEEGKTSSDYFSFSVSANSSGTASVGYYIYFTLDNNTLPTSAVKLLLSEVNNVNDTIENEISIVSPLLLSSLQPFDINALQPVTSSNSYLIYSDLFRLNNQLQTHNYRLRLWIDENYNINNDINTTNIENGKHISLEGQQFKIKLNVDAKSLSNLPNEYQELEYIESTGTQYIDTGFKFNQNTSIEIEFMYKLLINGSGLYGTYEGDAKRYETFLYSSDQGLEVGYYNNFDKPDIIINENTKYKIYQNKNLFYLDNNLVYTGNVGTFQQNRNAFIFSFNYNNGYYPNYPSINGKIYNCKIWDNNTLIREFIPCYRKSDNVIGMYDIVNGVFYTNQGTGNFIKGSDIN